ncbi:hypothetical protein EZV73_09740 [Acidaminobacter sp. JC074]|uniref:hypothetical protein n=1 Tax=Acidaminobacter sp. JC074 TaxID=2530199 RepID=UPI001F10C847|nr:hypothetical protein [Acidaminobacter sp. JC074]MCH4887855.1 hypothetical protein [Acidaminobacter sp. JC074]
MKARPNKALLLIGVLILLMTFRPMMYRSFGWFDTAYTKLIYEAETSYTQKELKLHLSVISDFNEDEIEVTINEGTVEFKMPYLEPSLSPMVQSRLLDLLKEPVKSSHVIRSLPIYYKERSKHTTIALDGYFVLFLVGVLMVISYIVLSQKDRYMEVE